MQFRPLRVTFCGRGMRALPCVNQLHVVPRQEAPFRHAVNNASPRTQAVCLATSHSEALTALCAAQLAAVGNLLSTAQKAVSLTLYTRTSESLALGTVILERCSSWPVGDGQRLSKGLTFDEDDVALLLRRQHVTLGSTGTVVCAVAREDTLLGLLAAEGVSLADDVQPWAPPGAPWTSPGVASLSAATSAVRLSLSATADAIACALELDAAAIEAQRKASAQAAEVASFMGRARRPLSALATAAAMLNRMHDSPAGGPQQELANALVDQTQRLSQLAASLEVALYRSLDTAQPIALPASEHRGQQALLPPAASHGAESDIVELLRPLLGALDGVARLEGKQVLAELYPGQALTRVAAHEVKAALSAALQSGLRATPHDGTLRVRVRHARDGSCWEVRVECGGSGDAAITGMLSADAGLQVVASQLAVQQGACVVQQGAVALSFPATAALWSSDSARPPLLLEGGT